MGATFSPGRRGRAIDRRNPGDGGHRYACRFRPRRSCGVWRAGSPRARTGDALSARRTVPSASRNRVQDVTVTLAPPFPKFELGACGEKRSREFRIEQSGFAVHRPPTRDRRLYQVKRRRKVAAAGRKHGPKFSLRYRAMPPSCRRRKKGKLKTQMARHLADVAHRPARLKSILSADCASPELRRRVGCGGGHRAIHGDRFAGQQTGDRAQQYIALERPGKERIRKGVRRSLRVCRGATNRENP